MVIHIIKSNNTFMLLSFSRYFGIQQVRMLEVWRHNKRKCTFVILVHDLLLFDLDIVGNDRSSIAVTSPSCIPLLLHCPRAINCHCHHTVLCRCCRCIAVAPSIAIATAPSIPVAIVPSLPSLPLHCHCAIYHRCCRRVAVAPSIAVAVVPSIAIAIAIAIAPSISVITVVLPSLHLSQLLLCCPSQSCCRCFCNHAFHRRCCQRIATALSIAVHHCCHCVAVAPSQHHRHFCHCCCYHRHHDYPLLLI